MYRVHRICNGTNENWMWTKGILLYYLWTSDLYLWVAFEGRRMYSWHFSIYIITWRPSRMVSWTWASLCVCVFVCKCWDGAWKDDITLLEWSILFLMKSVPNWMESVYRGLRLVAVAASFLTRLSLVQSAILYQREMIKCKIEFTCSCLPTSALLLPMLFRFCWYIKIRSVYACKWQSSK